MDLLLPENSKLAKAKSRSALRNTSNQKYLHRRGTITDSMQLELLEPKFSKMSVGHKKMRRIKKVDHSVADKVKSGANRDDQSESSNHYDKRSLKDRDSKASVESQMNPSDAHSGNFSESQNRESSLNEQIKQATKGFQLNSSMEIRNHAFHIDHLEPHESHFKDSEEKSSKAVQLLNRTDQNAPKEKNKSAILRNQQLPKLEEQPQKETIQKAIQDSEILTQKRIVQLAKERRQHEKKVVEDTDFELDVKKLKRIDDQLAPKSNAPHLLKPRRPSHMTELISSSSGLPPLRQESKTEFKITFQNAEIDQFINQKGPLPLFANFWAKIVLLIHIYILFTVFFFLGIAGFPSGAWLTIEIMTEIAMFSDIILRTIIRRNFPQIWNNMWVLHDKGETNRLQLFLSFLGSTPTTIICYFVVEQAYLHSFGLAMLRTIKLLRMRQINQYFDSTDIHDKQKIRSYLKSLQLVLQFLIVVHVIGSIWLVVGRLQEMNNPDTYTWLDFADFEAKGASDFERYLNSVFFVVSTMSGVGGQGKVFPVTFWEYFIDIFIMITGSSIYVGFFANFTVTIQNRNWRQIENTQKMEELKNFATLISLPEELKYKIRSYYNHMRLKYGKLYEKYKILHELPLSLRTELSLFINQDLIQKVKFFQLADPSFILTISLLLKPRLSMAGDFVIYRGEIATIMYFIKKGFVEILASDEKTIVAYLGEGSYFGEIGVLLTGKRTVSVRSKTPCIFFIIEKDELVQTLEKYPALAKYLKAVGRQRFQTTHPSDLKEQDQAFEEEKKKNEEVFDSMESGEEDGMFELKLTKTQQQTNAMRFMNVRQMSLSLKREQMSKELKEKRKVKWNLTKNYYFVQYFIIIPMSRLYVIWSVVISLAILYNIMLVPYCIALDVELEGAHQLIDLVMFAIYLMDVFMQLKTGIVNNKIEINLSAVSQDYIGFKIMLDVLAIIPFGYVLYFVVIDKQIRVFFRITRLFKFYRINEIIRGVRAHSNMQIPHFTMILMAFSFIILSHYMACIFIFIARREVGMGRRFDGKTMYENAIDRDYLNLPRFDSMSTWEEYCNIIYLSAGTMGAVIYGDILPLTTAEQLWSIVSMSVCRLFIAMMYAQAAQYLSEIHSSYSTYVLKLNRITRWMRLNNFPKPLIARVASYYDMIQNHNKGVDEQAALKDIPESMRSKIRLHIFEPLVENAEIFPSTADKGAISTLVQKLKIKIIPKGENIIRTGEIASEMYFIMKGIVKVFNSEGQVIAVLGKGHNFGEMALIQENSLRNACVVADTKVSVAILTMQDFRLICDLYPQFQDKISLLVRKRQLINQESEALKQDVHPQYADGFQHHKISQVSDALSQIVEESKKESSEWDSKKEESYQFEEEKESGDLELEESSYDSVRSSPLKKKREAIKISEAQRKEIQEELKQTKLKTTVLEMLDEDDKIRTIQIETLVPIPLGEKQEETRQANTLNTLMDEPPDSHRHFIPNLKNSALSIRSSKSVEPKSGLKKLRASNRFGSMSRSGSSSLDSIHKRNKGFTQKVNQIEEHLRNITEVEWTWLETLRRTFTLRSVMKLLVVVTMLYNMVFIPLQFAFSISFKWPFWFFEAITLTVLALDIYLRWKNLNELIRSNGRMSQSSNILERRLAEDKEEYAARKREVRFELICSIIAFFPFSMVFDLAGISTKHTIVVLLCLLRLVKIWPVYKFFSWCKKREVDLIRIFEAFFSYYFACHILTCYIISFALSQPDVRETWLRRIPVPMRSKGTAEFGFKAGFRVSPTMDDVTDESIYIHALQFVVTTVSHVAIGDITMVTTEERFFNAWLVLAGTFIYSYLFGNISSIVSDLAPNIFINFHAKYHYVMSRVNKEKTPKHIIQSISNYYDYMWANSKGLNEEQLIKELPQSISSDILLCRYQEAIENSIIFKDKYGNIDVALANSIMKLIKFRVYMRNDFIVKVGSWGSTTYLILDGEAVILGINKEVMGLLKSGCHYSSDLPKKMNQFGKKRIVHLIARTLTIVGVFRKEDIEYLYRCYPEWEKKMKLLNTIIRKAAQKQLNKHLKDLEQPSPLEVQLKLIEDHITYSNDREYDRILRLVQQNKYLNLPKVPNELNFLDCMKMKYYQKTGFVPLSEQDTFKLSKNPHTHKCKVRIKNFMPMEVSDTNLRKVVPLNSSDQKIKLKRTSSIRMHARRGIQIQDRAPRWLRKFYIQMNSQARFLIDFVSFINLFYIAISTSLQVGFNVKMNASLVCTEVVSLLFSIFVVIASLRTPVMVKGEATLKFRQVIKHQWHNGLLLDLISCLPFNLAFGILQYQSPFWAFVRCIRIAAAWKCLALFGQFQIYLKRHSLFLSGFKAFCVVFFLCHFVSCIWNYVQSKIQDDYPINNWSVYWNIHEKSLVHKYVFTNYCVLNIVCTVGYGDYFPLNDVERMFIIFMVNVGDALFALAFGLVASITVHISQNDEVRQFVERMASMEDFMNSFQINSVQRSRVEKFMAYTHLQKSNNELLVWNEMVDYLPYNLLKEVLYYNSRDLLTPMFSRFNSENLIRELAVVLENTIFLPGDFIIHKGDIGNEMYFIVQGRVFIIAADKQTVLNTLTKGNFFGEIAIFCESKRISFVQAETFCVMAVLKKKDIDRIVQSFPQVAVEFRAEGDKRKQATQAIENINILKKTQEQASEEEILMQYYKDSDDDEESEEESSEEAEPEMPSKMKSLAQKMNFNDKRGTVILLQGSGEASSSKKIKNRKKLTSIPSQGHVATDSESEELTVQKEELTVEKKAPKKKKETLRAQISDLARMAAVGSEEEKGSSQRVSIGEEPGQNSDRDKGIKGQPTQNGAKRRGTTIPSIQQLEEECKTITLIIPDNAPPDSQHRYSRSEVEQAVPVRRKVGILKQTGISQKEKTEQLRHGRFSESMQSISSASNHSPHLSLHASLQKRNLLDSNPKRTGRRPTVVHHSANGLLDPIFDPTTKTNNQIIKVLREARSFVTKSEAEEDIQIVGGIGDDGNLSLLKKEGPQNDLRRKGIKDQRRLSRISLGKNLMLSQTAGLKLQWTVGHN